MKRHWKLILALTVIFGGTTWFVAQLFLLSNDIVVSKQTTWLTEPLAADGLPDYAAYLLERGREGVTPENNGAVPFLQAMWPAELQRRHQEPLCEHLGMEVPAERGMGTIEGGELLKEQMLAWLKEKYPEATGAFEEEMPGDDEPTDEELPEESSVEASEESLQEGEEQGASGEMPTEGAAEEALSGEPADGEESAVGEGEEEVFVDQFGEIVEEPTHNERMWALLEQLQGRPWRREECPPLAEWIDRQAKHYDLLHEAANRPRFYCPSPSLLVEPGDSLVNMQLSSLQAMREGARALVMRAYLHLGEGDPASAWRDCEAIYRLGRHVSGDTIVGQLIAIALEEIANQVDLALLDSPSLTPEVARQMLAWHKSRPPRATMVDAIDQGERLMFVTAMLVYAGKRQQSATIENEMMEQELSVAGKVSINWNIVLKMGNAWHDKLSAAARLEDWHERRQALDEFENELNALRDQFIGKLPAAVFSRDARSRAVGDLMLSLYLPAVPWAFGAEDRANSHAQLHLAAAALAVHRLAEGDYPETLDPLVPGLLDSLPIDIHGQPLVYRRTDDGYLLYSLGPNGASEEGSHEMYRRYKGYELDEHNEAAIRVLLGIPPFNEDSAAVGVFEGEELSDPANFSLEGQIPAGADDWGLRLPLPGE